MRILQFIYRKALTSPGCLDTGTQLCGTPQEKEDLSCKKVKTTCKGLAVHGDVLTGSLNSSNSRKVMGQEQKFLEPDYNCVNNLNSVFIVGVALKIISAKVKAWGCGDPRQAVPR